MKLPNLRSDVYVPYKVVFVVCIRNSQSEDQLGVVEHISVYVFAVLLVCQWVNPFLLEPSLQIEDAERYAVIQGTDNVGGV